MDFKKHLEKYLDANQINDLVASFALKEQKGIFLNTKKMSNETFLSLFPNVQKHPFVENAYLYDKDEYELGKKVYHEQGAYYIQDPSAAIVASLLPISRGMRVLDLCAAPGGKTTQASLKIGLDGVVVANDLSKSRANILLSNVERMGLENIVVTNLDFSQICDNYSEYFDAIILDAPCSGSGMFRKMEEMKNDWTYEKVLKNAEIQKELILMAFSMLKPGGTLIYSTCSYSYEEDEEVVEYLLSKTPAKLQQIPKITGNLRSKKYPETIHLLPSMFVGEGHYIALIEKPGDLIPNPLRAKDLERKTKSVSGKLEIQRFSIPQTLDANLLDLSMRPGVHVETKTEFGIVPSHQESHVFDSSNSIELTKEETLQFLSGNTITKNSQPNGYFFVSYLGINLGVVHIVNGVLKNLYPKGLRFLGNINSSF